jgi:mannose-6-phosphate isomerase-like protein (cupin superfamily)
MNAEDDQHEDFQIHYSEVEPKAGGEEDGFRRMDLRFLVRADNAGSESVCVWRTILPPGGAHEPHQHPNAEEVTYIVRGRAAAGAGTVERELRAGSVRHVPAGVTHWMRNPSDEEVEIIGVYGGAASFEQAGHVFVEPLTDAHRQVS